MSNLFDYLKWRGDLSFSQVPPGPVDALIFSALSYIRFGDAVEKYPNKPMRLAEASDRFFFLQDQESRIRVKEDLSLLMAAANTFRFCNAMIYRYRDILIPAEETQFAAMTFLLDDGSALLAFRGTDDSLVGWKEDFNMSFQETVPAQRLALEYTKEIAEDRMVPLRLAGHSKGGNIAMFAAVKSEPLIRQRILAVYNNDGPGFRDYLMADEAYREMVPRLHTLVPQSSVIGMLLEHEEPYVIIKSTQLGLLQHEIYSWELDGPEFVQMEAISAHSHILNLTIKQWLSEMTPGERNQFVDTVFSLLGTGNVESAKEILHPKNLRNYFKTLTSDEGMRKVLSGELMNFVEATLRIQLRLADPRQLRLEEA